jgi:SAM-dependent methyltransferase
MQTRTPRQRNLYELLPPDAFSRADEQDDSLFYGRDRFVPHLDATALATVQRIIGELVVEPYPRILDLMASWDSHLPPSLRPNRVVGLGLNQPELDRNAVLRERVLHDLNRDPCLPFADRSFDVVLNTVSVDYLVRPLEVFREVARVLEPGGLHVVTFSNRMFATKAVKIWRDSSEPERIWLVEDYFQSSGLFTKPKVFTSQGRPRPVGDPYTEHGLPSDPVFVVYAEREGGRIDRPIRPEPASELGEPIDAALVAARKAAVRSTLRCPYCEEPLSRFDVALSPFLEWDNEYVYVCFNNRCPYLCSGWDVMAAQGNLGFSYRLMYDPLRDQCTATPIANPYAKAANVISPRG